MRRFVLVLMLGLFILGSLFVTGCGGDEEGSDAFPKTNGAAEEKTDE